LCAQVAENEDVLLREKQLQSKMGQAGSSFEVDPSAPASRAILGSNGNSRDQRWHHSTGKLSSLEKRLELMRYEQMFWFFGWGQM
jgi:hypothetical protein